MKIKPVIILGAGEHGLVIRNTLCLNKINKVLFLDDHVGKSQATGPFSKISDMDPTKYNFFVALGNMSLRKKWTTILMKQKMNMINVIHPKAYIENSVIMGKNIFIGAFTYINIGTRIGNGVNINNGCIIEHDNIINDYVEIAPRVTTGGGTSIKTHSFIGIGTTIIDHVVIGRKNIIGAGSVVVDSTEDDSLYLGVPAKKIRSL